VPGRLVQPANNKRVAAATTHILYFATENGASLIPIKAR